MKTKEIIEELNDAITKLKMRLIWYETENKRLHDRIKELKKFVKDK
tara:strand:- start:913 stop:1050 length:138 start_codon:yes stop_codon:yes gene_type:complete